MLKRLLELLQRLFGGSKPTPEPPPEPTPVPPPPPEPTPVPPPPPEPTPVPPPPPEPTPVPEPAPPAAPAVVTREAWGARPYDGTPVKQPRYEHLVLHHAAGFQATSQQEGIERMRQIQAFHQDTRGWSDVAYHFIVDQGGHVYQGRPYAQSRPLAERPDLVIGAHVAGQNTGKIGVCVLGCYNPETSNCNDAVSAATLDALVRLFAFLSHHYGIPPANIRGHRDFLATECPGSTLYPRLTEIRQRVEALLA